MTCQEYAVQSQPPDRLRLKIIDEILTLRCPRCKAAFLDFDGCFALKCNLCPCKFCGWCLFDCGNEDAHPHVLMCQHREPGADRYWGTEKEFHSAQNKRRLQKLNSFLETLDLMERTKVLDSITQDLQDLKLRL